MLSLDANVLFYAVDKAAGQRHAAAKKIIDAAAATNCGLTEQSLFELFHSVVRKAKIPANEATTVVQKFSGDFPILLPGRAVVSDALAMRARYGLSIWDARLLAVCASHRCDYLLSEDLQDGAQYGTVTVVDPFRAANAALLSRALTP